MTISSDSASSTSACVPSPPCRSRRRQIVCVRPPETPRRVAIIGAGLDLGAGRRGVDMGPSAIRYAELEARIRDIGHDVADWGDIRSPGAGGDRRRRFRVPATSRRSCSRASASPVSSARPSTRVSCRSCSAATTRSRWGRSAGWRRRAAPVPRSGSTRTATSTGPARRRAGTCTACRSPPRSASPAPRSTSDTYPTPSVTRAALFGIRSLDPGERELLRELDVEGVHDERDRPSRRREDAGGGARVPRRRARSCT